MRRFLFPALLWASPALADPVEGVWKTRPGDDGNFGHLQIAARGDAICSTIIGAFDSTGATMKSENIGKRMVWDMMPEGGGYGGGKIWAPDRDKTHASRMALKDDELNGSGYVLFIRRSQIWTRAR